MPNKEDVSIILTSRNLAKVAAVMNVARKILPGSISVTGHSSQSAVSETPIGDVEAIRGCINRIEHARSDHPEADLYVSIEGCIEQSEFGTFVYSWVVIEQYEPKRRALGCSAKVQLPDSLAKSASAGTSLADLTQLKYGTDTDVRVIGTNGVVTKGLFTRTNEFETALYAAFGYLLNGDNYA